MKKLILLTALLILSLNLFSQARINYVISKDTFKIQINGNEEHTFTVGKSKTDTADVDVILYNGADISNSFYTQTAADANFAPIANGVSNGNTHNHVGGDGAQISHTNLSNIGSNTHATLDAGLSASTAHISDASNPHGSSLTQTTLTVTNAILTSGGSIYSYNGTISSTATTTILDCYEENYGIWLLTFTGEHNNFSSTFHGFNAYLITMAYNTYTSDYQPFYIKLGEESYSSRVVVSTSGDLVRLQSSYADATYPLRWRLLRLR